MSERPYMPLYTGEALTSTWGLSAAEFGAVMLLAMHWHEHQVTLNDERARLVSRMTRREWSASKEILCGFFHPRWAGLVIDFTKLKGRMPVASNIRRIVFERDDYTCTYCGERGGKLECDHVFPASRGGTDDLENLTTSCFGCNRSKQNKTLSEWGGK